MVRSAGVKGMHSRDPSPWDRGPSISPSTGMPSRLSLVTTSSPTLLAPTLTMLELVILGNESRLLPKSGAGRRNVVVGRGESVEREGWTQD